MNSFLQTLWQNELRPFAAELAPVAGMMSRACAYCLVLLLAGGAVACLREFTAAKIGARPCRSPLALARRACLMFVKAPNVPAAAPRGLYLAAPLFAVVFALFFFFFLPVGANRLWRPDFGLLYLLFAASCGAYAVIAGAWSGQTRLSLFGAVRQIAQSVASQPVLAVVVMTILMTAGAGDLYSVIKAQRKVWFVLPHFPLFVLYLATVAATIGIAPFSAPKSGRGLAGGVFAGYGGAPLLFFETADNILLLLFSMLGAVLFLGGTRPVFCGGESPLWLIGKTVALLELFLVADAVLPDLRTDRTVDLNFKFFLPFALFWLAATAAVLTAAEGAL